MSKPSMAGLEILCPRKAWSHMAGMRCATYQIADGCGKGCSYKVSDETAAALNALRYREVALERARIEAEQAERETAAEERRQRFVQLFAGSQNKVAAKKRAK